MKKLIVTILTATLFLLLISSVATFAEDSRCAGLRPSDPKYALYKCTGTNDGTSNPCANLRPTDPAYEANNCKGANVGTPASPNFDLNIRINNPLKAKTVGDAVKLFMGVIFKLAIPVVVLAFLWTGISYILALGNPDKIEKVHNLLLYTVIGTLLLLGAWAITNAIVGTINAVINP